MLIYMFVLCVCVCYLYVCMYVWLERNAFRAETMPPPTLMVLAETCLICKYIYWLEYAAECIVYSRDWLEYAIECIVF